jgi:hypothetical protein
LYTELVWVVYWWTEKFIDDEQTHWEKFEKREQAREFLREVKKRSDFVKNDEVRQYKYIQLDPL